MLECHGSIHHLQPLHPRDGSDLLDASGFELPEVDPQTLSELPPEIRADIERQLALWRKTRRSAPPAQKKPRRSSSGMAVPLTKVPGTVVSMGFGWCAQHCLYMLRMRVSHDLTMRLWLSIVM